MKTVLITGATSAIGTAVCKALAERGAQLALHYHSNQEKADELAEWLRNKGCAYALYRSDLTDAANVKTLIEQVTTRFGRLDGLLNVVGPYVHQDVLTVTPEQWRTDLDLNLNVCFYTCRYAQDALQASRGHIINFAFSGVDNLKAWPQSPGYAAAKTGVVALSKSLAAALAPHKVRVNVLCPGLTEDEDIDSAERQAMAEQIPLGRPVKPEEIGNTAAWLLYDSPEAMTGTLLAVAGAWEY